MFSTARPALYPRAAWYFAVALAVAVAAFFPSFFARLADTGGAVRLHGASAFAWLVLLTLQAWLLGRGERRGHRALGRWSWLVVLPLVGAGVAMVKDMLEGATPFQQRFGPTLAFLDLTTLAYFATVYLLAIRWRRHLHLHARLMVSTAVLVLPPALARLAPAVVPGVESFTQALDVAMFATEAVVVALIVHDLRRWRLWPPYPTLLGFLALQHMTLYAVGAQPAWLAFCRWFAGL